MVWTSEPPSCCPHSLSLSLQMFPEEEQALRRLLVGKLSGPQDVQLLLGVMIDCMDLSEIPGLCSLAPRGPDEQLEQHRALLMGLFPGRANLCRCSTSSVRGGHSEAIVTHSTTRHVGIRRAFAHVCELTDLALCAVQVSWRSCTVRSALIMRTWAVPWSEQWHGI